MKIVKAIIGLFLILLFGLISNGQKHQVQETQLTNELIPLDRKSDYIFLNTIDGQLYAVGKHDGKIKWSIKEDAVLNFPKDYENPYFLTDPRDGSLYIFTNKKDGLKKFPYTIAELVSASPSKSADGFLYTGDKKDQWLAIDYRSGNKLDTLTAETLASTVSNADENVLFIGRTKYTISMFDINTRRKIFNLTYYDYSTHSAKMNKNLRQQQHHSPKDDSQSSYPMYHFSSSSDGTILTLDKRNGELKWMLKLDNPIVAMYRYESDQLFKIHFSIYSIEALTYLAKKPSRIKLLYQQQKQTELISLDKNFKPNKSPTNSKFDSYFSETLYVGFFNKNLYALPSYIGTWQAPLLTGPDFETNESDTASSGSHIIPIPINSPNDDILNSSLIDYIKDPFDPDQEEIDADFSSEQQNESNNLIGHHKLPKDFDVPPNYMQPNDKIIVLTNKETQNDYMKELFNIKNPPQCSADEVNKHKSTERVSIWKKIDQIMQNKYVWSIFTVIIASLFPLYKTIHDYRKKKARQQLRQHLINRQPNYELSSSTSDDDDDGEAKHKSVEFNLTSSRNSSNKTKRSNRSSQNDIDEMTRVNNHNSSHNKNSANLHGSYSMPEIGSDGLIKIGKITYDPRQVLGHGCAGTFVYKGTFENRRVAVKRLLPECYTLADREVELLRDADQHQNVLRYFCTESDSQFRYIALELCEMTLHEYINQGMTSLRPLSILEQATRGLDHLHSLDIVHRDIKPQNVLISFKDQKGNVNVMISDFGLCKRLETGINSFSKRSGITGTDGWIAPELIDDDYISNGRQDDENSKSNNSKKSTDSNTQINAQVAMQQSVQISKRVTKNVDIFSLGCVYYFVLSGGSHPFGDSIRRQVNIISNEYKLDKLLSSFFSEVHMQRILIEKMISNEPKKRLSTKEILAHPVFWSKADTLQFLLDVSDRIEKIEEDDPIVIELERGANVAIKNNWKCHICSQLQQDLRKFRSYNGVCVRDLLRAIRNKKHHYRELPPEVKQSLGNLPDEFIDYFTSRFPKLIMHVYDAMKCCAHEPVLDRYYKLAH